jgi:hypothetical protein
LFQTLSLMKITHFFFLLTLLPLLSFGQFDNKKTYTISQCTTPPKIDGVLNDKVWAEVATSGNFKQMSPNNGATERKGQETEVQICYDNNTIYFGIMMYDNAPDSILKELSKRDQEGKNFDSFGIWIDPYNNGQLSYNFLVSAAGVQTDAKHTNTSIDSDWDAVWKSAVKITDKGWIAEFSIPFSALRFPPNNNNWSLNMARGIRRYREHYTWNYIDVSYDNYAMQNGILNFLDFDIKSPLRLSVMPYITSYFNNYDGENTYPYNMGMDLKYGINESFTLDMTLVPDFGQVAPDDKVLNLSPFEVYYTEKRQFFTEGTELFGKAKNMFYTRRVSDDLINASKISGRTKSGLGIGALNAITKNLTNYNIMVFDQSLKNNSSVSFINTNKYEKGSGISSNVSGITTSINSKDNSHKYDIYLNNSNVFSDDEVTQGYTGKFGISKTKGEYKYIMSSEIIDDKYNVNDLGFLMRNNSINHSLNLSYNQLTPSKNLVNSSLSLMADYKTLFTEQEFTSLDYSLHSVFTLKNYTTIGVFGTINPYESIDFYEARTGNLESPFRTSKGIRGRMFVSSDYRKTFALDVSFGGHIKPLYNSTKFGWRIQPMLRVNDKLSFRYVLSINHIKNDAGFTANDENDLPVFALRNTNMITNVLTGSFVLNNKMDLAFKLRYHFDQVENTEFKSLDNDGYLYTSDYDGEHNINYTTWTGNLNFNWLFAPGSQMSIVWNHAITNYDGIIRNHWTDNVEQSLTLPQENSLSLKVIYYLDYLYIKNR